MDVPQIACIIIALVCGALVTWLVMRGKTSQSLSPAASTDVDTEDLHNRISSLEDELSKSKTDYAELKSQSSSEKEKYTRLLEKANSKISELNEAISSSISEGATLPSSESDKGSSELEEKVKQLGRDVEKLEEELEEAEDDLDEQKKKLRKKSEECDNLQKENEDQLRTLKKKEHEIEELNSSIQAARQELKDKTEELGTKTASIRFVQEVLTAERVKTSDVQALSKQIDKIVDFIQGELRDNINRWTNIKNEAFFHQEAEKWAYTRKKTWLRNKTTIAFVGEFSAGKTSIVNRILSQDDESVPKLPVSTKATTAIPTYVSGAASGNTKPLFAFLTQDNILKEISKETFELVTKEVLEQMKGVSSLIKYFVMKYNNDNLKNLSILDTPGFNSNDSEDAIRTIDVINECDALFWVVDVNNGTVNRSSLKVIKDNLTKPLYIVINKVDTKAPGEVDKVEALIRKQLEVGGLTAKGFIRFSSKAELEAIMKPIQSIQKVDKGEYIELIIDKVKASVRALDKDRQEARQAYDSKSQKVSQLSYRFRTVASSLKDDCSRVSDIPYYDPEEGFLNFRDPNYKISVGDKEEFDELLDNIASSHAETLEETFYEQEQATKEQQEAYSDYKMKQGLYNMLEESMNKLDKLVMQLNQMA